MDLLFQFSYVLFFIYTFSCLLKVFIVGNSRISHIPYMHHSGVVSSSISTSDSLRKMFKKTLKTGVFDSPDFNGSNKNYRY